MHYAYLADNPLVTGFSELDELIPIGTGVITFRSDSQRFLSFLAARVLACNQRPPKKALYLHWLDYHSRYWSLNFDLIVKTAKLAGVDPRVVVSNTVVQRAFSPDAVEAGENLESVFGHTNVAFAILDSLNDYVDSKQKKTPNAKPQLYAIQNFARLCMRNECTGIILDRSRTPVHPFLAGVSSVVIDFEPNGASALAHVVKHYSLSEHTIEVSGDPQKTLWKWTK